MRYGSVCSGIEAASAAWHPLGWRAAWFSEIEPFPCSVLKHHYPDVPNLGDMTQWETWPDEPIDILVGGTPCQSFSVAGKRGGMDDPRGRLALAFSAIARRYRPRWIVWENVPGVLSSGQGRDFGSFLGSLVKLGYGCAYRVLDAQHFGVAQRRRRVFVVGHLGDWRRAAAVLFERESLCRNPAKGGKAREGVAGTLSNRTAAGGELGTDFELGGGLLPVGKPLLSGGHSNNPLDENLICFAQNQLGEIRSGDVFNSLSTNSNASGRNTPLLAFHATRRDGGRILGDISPTVEAQWGTGGGNVPNVAIPLKDPIDLCALSPTRKQPAGWGQPGDPAFTMRSGIVPGVALAFPANLSGTQHASTENLAPSMGAKNPTAIAFKPGQSAAARTIGAQEEIACTLEAGGGGNNRQAVAIGTDCYNGTITGDVAATMGTPGSSVNASGPTVMQAMQVRRLTPIECERLQGFPDNYTYVPHRGKPAADGPRYKALGNSMAVPCMAWIGKRIQMVEDLTRA